MEPLIKWELTQAQAQYILNVLDTRPHNEVRAIIDVLMEQARRRPDLKVVEIDAPEEAKG